MKISAYLLFAILLVQSLGSTVSAAEFSAGVAQRMGVDSSGVGSYQTPTFVFGLSTSLTEFTSIAFDWSNLSTDSYGGSVRVTTKESDYFFWGHYALGSGLWEPYVGLGAGSRIRKVETQVGPSSSSDQGKPEFLMGSSLGVRSRGRSRLNMGVEFRLLKGSETSALTAYELLTKLLVQF